MTHYTSYSILHEQKLIIANFQGKIKLDELVNLLRQLIADKNYKPSYNFLIDFSGSIAIAFSFDVLEFLIYFEETVSLEDRIRCGILLRTPNFKFLVSFAKSKSSHLNIEIEDFFQLEECLTWMNYSHEEQITVKERLNSIKSEYHGLNIF